MSLFFYYMENYAKKYSKEDTPIVTRKDGVTVHTRSFSITKAVEPTDDANIIKFVITDETVDRYGDIVRANGMVADNYLKNPVVLMHHESHGGDLPPAKCIKLEIVDTSVVATVEFDTDATAQEILRKIKGGFLNCVSIGFCAIEWEENKESKGLIFNKWELYEFSIVKVPANPNAGRIKSLQTTDKQTVKIEVKRIINKGTTMDNQTKAFEFMKTLFKLKAFDPAQLETAKEEIFTAVSKGVKDHLMTYGIDDATAQKKGDFCGDLVKTVYQYALSESAPVEEPTTAEDAPVESDAAKFLKLFGGEVEKAGSAHSAATKAEVKRLYELSSTFHKAMKAFNDKVHKADVEPEPEKQADEVEQKQPDVKEPKQVKTISLADYKGLSIN